LLLHFRSADECEIDSRLVQRAQLFPAGHVEKLDRDGRERGLEGGEAAGQEVVHQVWGVTDPQVPLLFTIELADRLHDLLAMRDDAPGIGQKRFA
jgi:hypothetical protein